MSTEHADLQPLEVARPGERRSARRAVAQSLLEVARGEQPLEHAELPGELAAAFLRRYDNREETQKAYALDLADWFVWLRHAGVEPFEVTLATVEAYMREPLPSGKPPAPSAMARRLA